MPGKIDPIPRTRMAKICRAPITNRLSQRKRKRRQSSQPPRPKPWEKTYVLLPSYEKVKADKVLYAHASVFCTMKPTPAVRVR